MPTEELFGNYNFLLEVAGITPEQKTIIGGFKSMSGMTSETEVIEFKQGNDMVVRKKPGRTTYSNIVLERGYTATDDLWQWRKNIEDGVIDRRAVCVEIDRHNSVGRVGIHLTVQRLRPDVVRVVHTRVQDDLTATRR